jgi:1,4-alpha-glucan branching enzyme
VARPSGIVDGINKVTNQSVILSLYAPYKEFVYVVGDFNNWEVDPAYQMKKHQVNADSVHYWLEISGLDSSIEYAFQYFVDGNIFIADPYSEKILDPWNDQWINEKSERFPNLKPFPVGKADSPVTVFKIDEDEYTWKTQDFERPNKDAVVFYELLIRDFAKEGTYRTLIDTIGYFKRLGVNAIELMPISEFDGNDSWGYNPAFHMALDKYYGSKNELKEFVDSCHANGIAVVVDMVFNHATGLSPLVKLYQDETKGTASANSIYANSVAKHPFSVFNDLNHESSATNYWMKRVLRHWLEEFKLDGFRFDLSKGHTQKSTSDVGAWNTYDQWRINHWKDNYNFIESVTPGAYVILEHLGNDDEERALASAGMMLWGKMTEQYNEASMGWSLTLDKSRFNRAFHITRGFSTTGLVAYMESHDEERLMYKNAAFGNSANPGHNAKLLAISTQRTATTAAFLFFIPGPKMLWMFGELGYDISIFADENGKLPAGSYGSDDRYKTGRKPILWNYTTVEARKKMFNRFSDIIKLRTTNPVFNAVDVNVTINDTRAQRRIQLDHSTNKVNVVANFDISVFDMSFEFPEGGKWYEFFSGDSIDVTDVHATYAMQPAELRIYSKVKFDLEPTDKVVTSNESIHSDLPKTFELNSVYPNPFNPATTIQYSMPSTTNLTIDVIDIMGRQVANLHNGVQVAGVHTLNWDASKAASGIYLIRMQTGSQVFIRKVTLLK